MDRFSETLTFEYASPSNVCDHCKNEVMEDLREVHEYRRGDDRFYACHGCYDECMEAIERQAEELERREIILRAARIHARMSGALVCCHCKTTPARWNSLYCSESCHKAFLTFPEVA